MAAPLILRMGAAPVRRARFAHYVIAALAALCLGFAAATPARADNSIDACFNAVADTAKAGIDAAKSAPDFISNNCEQWANPATAELFAAVAGIVTVLEAGGAFKGGDCKDFMKTKIAAALVAALAGAIGGNSPLSLIVNALPDSVQAEIQQLANNISSAGSEQAANAAAGQAYDLLSNIPVIGQAISMLPCACVVADAAVKAGSDLAKAGSEGGKCAEFALACAENPLYCAQSLFESGWDALKDIASWVWGALGAIWDAIKDVYCNTIGKVCNWIPGLGSICGCSGDPPPPSQVDCVGGAALGGDVRDLGNGVKVSVSSDQFCSCPATMKWQQHGDGAWTCDCPHPGEVQVAYGICQCPAGKGLLEGSCQACPSPLVLKYGACTCSVEGQNFMKIGTTGSTYFCSCPNGQGTAGNKCAPACTDVSKTLTADGICCSPSQVSSCGVCCPQWTDARPQERQLRRRAVLTQARAQTPHTAAVEVAVMPSTRHQPAALRKQARIASICFFAAAVVLVCIFGGVGSAIAQNAPAGILAPGNSAVTGFSGAIPPAQIPPGVDPRETTFIDLAGPSARIVDLQNMAGPPDAQLVPAPKPFTVTAAQVGQVFAVVLDNSTPPNIYVAATSAYGLPIVAPAADGKPLHVKSGAANASFMPGLWGGAAPSGGPGSIWKIDGVTGAVSLFANVTLNGTSNSGPALGGLAFDPDSNSLFAADRDTGMIHRFAMNGAERGRYDHGVQGRTAQGLSPVPFDPKKRLAVTNPKFDSEQPATWSYAPPERLIFGLGVLRGRLYYAVAAGLQIWSVGLSPDGSFANDAMREIDVPPAAGPTEISKISFDDRGRMFLAERPAPTGAFDFEALTPEGIGRILRYAVVDSYPGAPRVWQQVPDEYAIGFPLQYRNGNGGVAIGYDYDAAGMLNRASCGGLLWSTGERLRKSADPALAARLQQSGPENVDGLQGNRIELVRPQNAPPLKTYFIDYDDRFDDDAARGHMGDLAIWRVCGPLLRGGWMPPGWMLPALPPGGGSLWFPPPPSKSCPPGQQQPGLQCCPTGASPDPSGQCKAWCPNGAMDPGSQELCGYGFDNTKFDPNNPGNSKCIDGTSPDPALGMLGCVHASPLFMASVCPAGWSKQNEPKVGLVCAPTAKQLACGQGEQVSPIDNQCHALCPGGGIAWPTAQCCPPGAVVSVTGQCCPPGSKPDPKSGKCGPPTSSCPPGQLSKIDNTCCPSGQVPNNVIGGCCPAGQIPDPVTGICKQTACAVPPNTLVNGKCCSPNDLKQGGACWNCGPGKTPIGPNNFCCDESKVYTDANGAKACCLGGTVINGKCGGGTPMQPGCSPSSTDPNCCASGYKPTGSTCCLESQLTTNGICCPAGQTPSGPNKDQCQPSHTGWKVPWVPDGDGTHDGWKIPKLPDGGCTGPGCFPLKFCCASGLIPTADNSSCCAPNLMTIFGTCCPADNPPNPKTGLCPTTVKSLQICAPGYTKLPDGSCCLNRLLSADGKTCGSGQGGLPVIPVPSVTPIPGIVGCGPDMHKDPRSGTCVADQPPARCSPPNRMVGDRCCSPREIAAGQCGPKRPQPTCGPDQIRRGNTCVDIVRRPIPPPVFRRPPPLVRRPIAPPVIRRFER